MNQMDANVIEEDIYTKVKSTMKQKPIEDKKVLYIQAGILAVALFWKIRKLVKQKNKKRSKSIGLLLLFFDLYKNNTYRKEKIS